MTKRERQYVDSLGKTFTGLLNDIINTDMLEYETKIDLLKDMDETVSLRRMDLRSGE